MSLTSHLSDPRSPVREFMVNEFPYIRPYVEEGRKTLRGSRTIRPVGTPPWNIIGRAIDYRLRYYFAVTPWDDFAAYKGQRWLTDTAGAPIDGNQIFVCRITDEGVYWHEKESRQGVVSVQRHPNHLGFCSGSNTIFYAELGSLWDEMQTEADVVAQEDAGASLTKRPQSKAGYSDTPLSRIPRIFDMAWNHGHARLQRAAKNDPLLRPPYEDFFVSLDKTVERLQPVRKRLPESEEDEMALHCVILGLLETAYRTSSQDAILKSADPQKLSDLFSIVESNWTEDLRNLSRAFYDRYRRLLDFSTNLNPEFAYSHLVSGADADLIVNDMLIDIKTTMKPRLDEEWIWQLLGYVLLDRFDEHKIRHVGLYMARQARLVWWDLDEMVKKVSGKDQSVEELRERFYEIVPDALEQRAAASEGATTGQTKISRRKRRNRKPKPKSGDQTE